MPKMAYQVEKLPPYTITEEVFTPKKDKQDRHLGFERSTTTRTVKDGRMLYFPAGHSIRIEGGDAAVEALMRRKDTKAPVGDDPGAKRGDMTPKEAVQRVLAKADASRIVAIEEAD